MTDCWPWHVPSMVDTDEEGELIALSDRGDVEARARLVMSNFKMVLFIAALKARSNEEKKDLIGEGLLGAWVAAQKYDSSRGVKFCTYATWWIRSYIVQSKKKKRRFLAFAPDLFKLNKELARAYAMTGKGICDESVVKDVASRMGTSPGAIRKMWNSTVQRTEFDAPVHAQSSQDNDGLVFSDIMASAVPDPEEELFSKERAAAVKGTVKSVLSVLSDKEALVVKRVLMGGETFASVGKKLGVSKQRVKQICDKAVAKMRKRAASDCSSFRIHLKAG
jgi:RNA polymerase sigma factor (sigma-70 family)